MPRADDAVAVARVLGVSVEYLVLGDEATQPAVPKPLRPILDDLMLLPPNRLEDVSRMVRLWADDARAEAQKREASAG